MISEKVTEHLRELDSAPSTEFKRMPEIWNKECDQRVKQEEEEGEGEGKTEGGDDVDAHVQKEGEFYDDAHDN